MITKAPKSQLKKWFKRGVIIAFVGEGLLFAGSYFAWYKINTEREYRKYLNENYPSVLNWYYKVGEYFDANNKIREVDNKYWQNTRNN